MYSPLRIRCVDSSNVEIHVEDMNNHHDHYERIMDYVTCRDIRDSLTNQPLLVNPRGYYLIELVDEE